MLLILFYINFYWLLNINNFSSQGNNGTPASSSTTTDNNELVLVEVKRYYIYNYYKTIIFFPIYIYINMYMIILVNNFIIMFEINSLMYIVQIQT